jgi:hypothetical protein
MDADLLRSLAFSFLAVTGGAAAVMLVSLAVDIYVLKNGSGGLLRSVATTARTVMIVFAILFVIFANAAIKGNP